MTGTSSGCQNCFPPKDEELVSDFFYCIHPKGEEKSLRETAFLGGITGGG
jgi:hypothetical protein